MYPSAVACEAGAVLCDVECFGLEPVYVVKVDVFSQGPLFFSSCVSVCLLGGCRFCPDALDSAVVELVVVFQSRVDEDPVA